MGNEKYKINGWRDNLTIILAVATLAAIFISYWLINQSVDSVNKKVDNATSSINQRVDNATSSINQRVDGVNQRIDGVYTIVSKSDKAVVEMKTGIEARFTGIEKRLATIEIGISSLQARDDSIKEDKPPTEMITPYREGESGPKTTPYQSP